MRARSDPVQPSRTGRLALTCGRVRGGHIQRLGAPPPSPRVAFAGMVVVAVVGLSSCTTTTTATSAPAGSTTTSSSVVSTDSPPDSTTPMISVPPFTMETCGQIVTNPNRRPTVNHENLLLTSTDVPNGYTGGIPHITVRSLPVFVASVPSTAPVVYTTFSLDTGPTQSNGGTLYTQTIAETIGDVGSAPLATEMVGRIRTLQLLPQCGDNGSNVTLPGPVSDLVVAGAGGSPGAGPTAATVMAAKGAYVINVMWTNSTNPGLERDAPPGSVTPPLPSPAAMASVVDAALARLPS
jgi:hypothetical protein